MPDLAAAVRQAEARIRPYVRETYLEPSPRLSAETGAEVFLKLEHLQHTGSFKVRGALNKLLVLSEAQRARGVVAASTGNHGAAVAYAGRQAGARALVFVPETADAAKVEAIRALGGEVQRHGTDGVEAEVFARRYAEEHELVYISPYNDADVVAGQGTLGLELLRQLPRVDAVIASLGGGGLVGGLAGLLKAERPGVRVVAASPENSAVMIESVRAGQILELASQPTLSDGTAGGVEAGALTFDLCRALVDDFVTVTEAEIARALRDVLAAHHQLVEGAAAVAVAALRKQAAQLDGQTVGVILCGANISLETLRRVL